MRWKPKTKPPAGAPWWWPGEQLRLFEPEPTQPALFTVASECGCSSADPKPKRRRRRAAA